MIAKWLTSGGSQELRVFDEAIVHLRATSQALRKVYHVEKEPAPGVGPGAGGVTLGSG